MTTDPDAEFTALVQRQSRFVFRVAYAVLLNSYDAEDAVQETFLKLYRNRGWEQAENERAYLARVAWRALVKSLSSDSVGSTIQIHGGADYDTIRRQLQISDGALRGLLSRGMALLRERMTPLKR